MGNIILCFYSVKLMSAHVKGKTINAYTEF